MQNIEILASLKNKANKLPMLPGVYLMKDKRNQIIYVGKAKLLKNRVTQYFGKGSNHTEKVRRMVTCVVDFDYILCDSEYEALMLENSLIKQYQPKYNVLLKDDKGYHYIKITDERWPKIVATKNKLKDKSRYLGPYYSGYIVRETVDEVNRIFKLPTCNRDFNIVSKPCLNYHIGLCFAPCKNPIAHNEYVDTVNNAINYIKKGGMNNSEISELKKEMELAAENLDFELAAKLRDRIKGIEKSQEKQKVVSSSHKNQDVFSIATSSDVSCVSLLIFRQGRLCDKKNFYFDGVIDKSEIYSEFFLQYYSSVNDIPPRIVVDVEIEDKELIERWLSDNRNSSVKIFLPQKGEQIKLLNMCLNNAIEGLSQKIERNSKEMSALTEFSTLLGLSNPPKRIEAYDISNTSGSNNVAAMVVYINGRPEKSLYRRFMIKSFVGQDDYRSMAEVLDRRLNEYFKGEDESFKELPELILLDGGKGHVSAVVPILKKHNLDIKLFGMVKDSKHRTRAITEGGQDIQIKANRKTFTFVTNIQDEVHRFAISYHKQKSKNANLTLELLKIDGVGEITAKKLLKSFKTISKIKSATTQEFIELGINKKTAENIVHYYKK